MAKFRSKPIEVEAFQVNAAITLAPATNDPLNQLTIAQQTATPGDWIVRMPDGTNKVMSDAALKAEFDEVRPPGRQPGTPQTRTPKAAPGKRRKHRRVTTPQTEAA